MVVPSTFFAVIIYAQAFISTGFAADKILIWTPLILVIDASSMLQIFFLVLEANPVFVRGRIFLFDPQEGEVDPRVTLGSRLRRWYSRRTSRLRRWYRRRTSGLLTPPAGKSPSPNGSAHQLQAVEPIQEPIAANENPQHPLPEAHPLIPQTQPASPRSETQPSTADPSDEDPPPATPLSPTQNRTPTPPPAPQPPYPQNHNPEAASTHNLSSPPPTSTPSFYLNPALYAALSSALLYIAVIILQIMGLHAASTARHNSAHSLKVSWCSPLFQPFGIAVTDGNCNVYTVDHSPSRGIGCILIPGVWQRQWLTITIVGTTLSLILQLADLVILSLVSGTRRWRGVKMKRPWTTMVSGLVVLGITLFFGLQYASTLPPGITGRVTVAVDVNETKAFDARLTSAGLRGTILGWNDGLFESWKESYTGTSEL